MRLTAATCARTSAPAVIAAAPVVPAVLDVLDVLDVLEIVDKPATWSEALARHSSTCPVPFFTLPAPHIVNAGGGRVFEIAGSTMAIQGDARWSGPLKIGVLGAIKDADAGTRQNLQKAQAAFKKAGVQFVVVNGEFSVTKCLRCRDRCADVRSLRQLRVDQRVHRSGGARGGDRARQLSVGESELRRGQAPAPLSGWRA